MARYRFGGGIADWTLSTVTVSTVPDVAQVTGGVTIAFWSAETAGDQYTDLLDSDGAAVSTIVSADGAVVRASGQIPPFWGPDGVTEVWASANGGPRSRMVALGHALPLDGGTMTGPLTLADGSPAASEAYVAASASASVLVAPAPTGVQATDQAAVQALVTKAQATGGTVVLQPGTYVMDLTTTEQAQQPRIIGMGERITRWNGTLTLNGVPGSFSGGYLADFSFTGTRAVGVPCLRIRGACSVRWDRIAFNATADIGVLFENDATHLFTETCAGQAHFPGTIKTPVEYRVSAGGNPSFHGCGLLEGSTINQSATDTGPKVKIGAGAEPYNCPMSVTFWARTAQPLIRHDGLQWALFYGVMKIELLPPNARAVIVDPASASDLPLVGALLRRGKRVDAGRLVIADEVITESYITRPRRGGAETRYALPGRVLRVDPDGNPEWVPTRRINRATNPVANDTANVSGYNAATVAAATDSSLGSAKVWTVTTTTTGQVQGLIYLQAAGDLAQGQVKTVAFDIVSPVDIVMYAGGRFGLSGSPGVAEVGESGTLGDIVYLAAGHPQRVRRKVVVPAPNSGGTITHEGFYIRANTVGDMPAAGTVFKVSNVTIEDGDTSASRFSGAADGEWLGTAHQSQSAQYPTQPAIAEVAYTPTLTNVSIGNGTVEAYYSKVGKRVQGSFYLLVGNTTAITGTIQFSLPPNAPLVAGTKRRYNGGGWINDASTSTRYQAGVLPIGTTSITLRAVNVAGTYATLTAANATVPMVPEPGDEYLVAFEYETA